VKNEKNVEHGGERVGRHICRLCWKKISENRSSHLRRIHGVDARGFGAVQEYFLRPEDLNIPIEEFERLPEGSDVQKIAKYFEPPA
jgi:hypothetical protein